MTPSDVQLILGRLDDMAADLADVKALATATNGRVRKLEIWRARIEGAQAAVGKLPVLLACGGSTVAIALGLVALI